MSRRRMPPSQRWPRLRPVAVAAHRARRRLGWLLDSRPLAGRRDDVLLDHVVWRHSSPLIRPVHGDDLRLQRNKVANLRLVAARFDGVVLRPGETFSFNRTVGNCTRSRGYLEGMTLSRGRPTSGVGGGICQAANLLHWLVLHSPLTVVERSDHSFDAFPDHERTVPWGVGCTIVYNYVDLVVRNDTETTFGLRVEVEEHHLTGALLADRPLPVRYEVEARGERFERVDGEVRRRNEIWRTGYDAATGQPLGDELVKRNDARVRYAVEPALLQR